MEVQFLHIEVIIDVSQVNTCPRYWQVYLVCYYKSDTSHYLLLEYGYGEVSATYELLLYITEGYNGIMQPFNYLSEV